MRSSEGSLVRRVGWAAAGVAFASGLVTLLVALVVVDHLEQAEAEEHASELADALVRELDASDAKGPAELAEEVDEFTHGALSIAVVDGDGQRLAGPDEVPLPARQGCGQAESEGSDWLVCSVESRRGRRVIVGSRTETLFDHRGPLLAGGLVALLVVLLASAFIGVLFGRWSLTPLRELQRSVAAIDSASPEDPPRFERHGLKEVDDIAAALDALVARLGTELSRAQRFAANAAHELRTPLAKLRAEIELAGESLPAESEPRRELERAALRTEELATLVDRLLLLASPEDAIQGETLTSVAVVVESTIEALDDESRDRVSLALEDDGMVMGDSAVLSSAVSNAIGNALTYSRGEVRVRLFVDDSDIVLRVDDDGPGLGETRERAFEPFFRGPRERSKPGHGIGLALIAHIARAHGGRASFLPEDGGAKLELRLPAHVLG